jgi:GPH family glycoside/pentoside/hexuronide:cation symporter
VKSALPLSKQIAYAFGMMGWSILTNIISVILVYLYAPPENIGLPNLITQVAIFGFLNAIALITTSGRFIDAVYDPFIAQVSDRSQHPKGRRIPMMKKAILPSLLFCCLVFFPLHTYESVMNIIWVALMLILFYVSTTTYVIPYYALLPELAPTSEDKVKLATWQSVGFVVGIGTASNVLNVTDLIQTHFGVATRLAALQYSVVGFVALAGIALLIPVLAIDEKKYSKAVPHAVPLKTALLHTLKNSNFRLFIIADFSYFIAVTIITTGLLYFLTVLLQLDDKLGNVLMITMVLVSFIFYPVVNYLAKRIGKKRIVVFSLLLLSGIFLGIYFLGKFPIGAKAQIFLLIGFAAIPLASLNILPNAILAEIIEKDSKETGENKEAIFFAVRYFFVKIAMTFGIALFSMLLIFGKDVGNDFGIRLNGLLGFGLCFMASLIFLKFKEEKNIKKGD